MSYAEEAAKAIGEKILGMEMRSADLQTTAPVASGQKFITGYWEDWTGAINPNGTNDGKPEYYANDIKPMTHVVYAFLTLDQYPNPWLPNVGNWNGTALYENMTQADITQVLPVTDPAWKNPYDWQRVKI